MTQLSMHDSSIDLNALDGLKNDQSIMIDVELGQQLAWEQHLELANKAHQQIASANLECGIVHSNVSIDDIDTIVKAVEIAHALNSEFITVALPDYDGSAPYRALLADARGCFQDLNQISSETGVDALLAINTNSIAPNADAAMRILEGLDPSQVGVLFDPTCCDLESERKRSVDVLGPFIRAISIAPNDGTLLKSCLDNLDPMQEVLSSVSCADPKTAQAVLS